MRPKFDRYVSRIVREPFLTAFLHAVETVVITETIRACRDEKDDKFLEVAVSGGASAIVTGDSDLLVLDPFGTIRILTPRQYQAAWGLPE